jgi:hypothetical protein
LSGGPFHPGDLRISVDSFLSNSLVIRVNPARAVVESYVVSIIGLVSNILVSYYYGYNHKSMKHHIIIYILFQPTFVAEYPTWVGLKTSHPKNPKPHGFFSSFSQRNNPKIGYSIPHVYGLNSHKIGMLKSPSRFVYLYPKLAMYFRQLPGPRTEARRLCTQCRDGCVPPRCGECCNGKKQERRGQQNATSCLVKAKDRISWINAVFVAGWWFQTLYFP